MRSKMMTRGSLVALSCALAVAACTSNEPIDTSSGQRTAANAPTACADIVSLSLTNTTIETAETIEAGALGPTGPAAAASANLPAFCRVTGSIAPTADSDIKFELWLPTEENWNGKFMQTGNGGAAGSIMVSSLPERLARGYAVTNTDTGHTGGGGDFSWAFDHPEKVTDYQYRAVHELTVVGKAITTARYGRAPDMSYWYGCSTGGRQGLKEVQMYPDDYDAVVAGAPANNWASLQLHSIFYSNNLGENGLPLNKLRLLNEGAVSTCDSDDGVADGVISRPSLCEFDPVQIQCADGDAGATCLTPDEVAAARRLYDGPRLSDGTQVMPGPGFGSETAWAANASPAFQIGTSFMRNVVLKDLDWDPAALNLDVHYPMFEEWDQGRTKAMVPDISAFTERGGKLLMYHGTTDGLIAHDNTVNYYESVVDTMGEGAVADSVRFFSVPGMGHCAGGPGVSQIDWLSEMEEWVETGEAPDVIIGAKPGAGASAPAEFTRPLCAWPKYAQYDGSGDPTQAASFSCVTP